ncbi:hypothetical protein TruAng_005684 [Truncatella angustata]|nr:hypothetical protein TruAng_005684 [Truncatella angustata]
MSRVAVIGAGALGLMALKNFQEDGFDVTGFEARPYIGGLWKESDDDSLSVHSTTIFNTSKFRTAISDYPFSEEADVYPTAAQLHKYLNDYADHFDIRRRVKLSCRVSNIIRTNDKWEITVKDLKNGDETREYFDRICIATGSFCSPRWPKLKGLEKFGGQVLHSINFHGSEPFEGHNVLILGIHATAQDVTHALSGSAKQVYLSHRQGLLLVPRYTGSGVPSDAAMKLPVVMLQSFMDSNCPSLWYWLVDKVAGYISDKNFGDIPESWGLKPRPSMAVATPLMADTVWPYLKSGFAEPVAAVQEITGPRTVVLTNGRVLEDIDTILYCTGYDHCLPSDLIPRPGNSADRTPYEPYPEGPGKNPHLYKNIFPLSPDSEVQTSLAFIGQGATFFPGFLQFELQVMAVSQVWRGRSTLPPYHEMINWHKKHTAHRLALAKKHRLPDDGTTFYSGTIPFGDLFPWLNEMAGTGIFETFGGKCNGLFNIASWKFWWEDRELYDLCTKRLLSPAVFRVVATSGRKALDRSDVMRILTSDNAILDRAVKAKREDTNKDGKAKMT